MIVRVFLLCGLIVHKLIWEIWKRKYRVPDRHKSEASPAKRLVKAGKVGFLLFLMLQTAFFDVLPVAGAPAWLKWSGVALFFAGLLVSISARIHLGPNWSDLEDLQVLPSQQLVTKGIYRYIRHPIYMGDVLLVTGLELALQSWLFVIGILLAIITVRQAIKEEKLLAGTFPEYKEYCLRTKRFLPFLV